MRLRFDSPLAFGFWRLACVGGFELRLAGIL